MCRVTFKIHIYGQFLINTKFGNQQNTRPPHSTQDILTPIHNILTLILIINIPHDISIVDNIFMNNYTLHECTHGCTRWFKYDRDKLWFVYTISPGHVWTTLYYLLCKSAPWWWSSATETRKCYKLRKHIICAFCWFLLVVILQCTV
jgi:hypothetical protein